MRGFFVKQQLEKVVLRKGSGVLKDERGVCRHLVTSYDRWRAYPGCIVTHIKMGSGVLMDERGM